MKRSIWNRCCTNFGINVTVPIGAFILPAVCLFRFLFLFLVFAFPFQDWLQPSSDQSLLVTVYQAWPLTSLLAAAWSCPLLESQPHRLETLCAVVRVPHRSSDISYSFPLLDFSNFLFLLQSIFLPVAVFLVFSDFLFRTFSSAFPSLFLLCFSLYKSWATLATSSPEVFFWCCSSFGYNFAKKKKKFAATIRCPAFACGFGLWI